MLRRPPVACWLVVSLLLGCGRADGDSSLPTGKAAEGASTTQGSTTIAAGSGSGSAVGSGSGSVAASGAGSGAPAASGSAIAPRAPAIASDPAAAERASALVAAPPRPVDGKGAGFSGPVDPSLDGEWLARMASAEIVEITPNKGGGSVSMRVRFKDGKKAALKAEQTGHPTDPRSEIAGYHMDRILGFGRTAPVVGRRFAMAEVRAALAASKAEGAFLERLDKLVVRDDHIDAALIAWHTAPLVEEETAPSWTLPLDAKEPVVKDQFPKLAEWSDLVVFDFLVDNPDRYSGGNILRLDKGGPLVFLDQGAAFGRARLAAGLTTKEKLEKDCRFRKETLAALKKVGAGAPKEGSLGALLQKSVARDPLAPVLDAAQVAGVDARVRALEAHVKACSTKLGAAHVLASGG